MLGLSRVVLVRIPYSLPRIFPGFSPPNGTVPMPLVSFRQAIIPPVDLVTSRYYISGQE